MFRSYGPLVLAAAFAICCRGGKEQGDPRQAAECARGFEAALNAPAGERVGKVIDGCSRACPGLVELARNRGGVSEFRPSSPASGGGEPSSPDQVTGFLRGCELFCSDAARSAWNLAAVPERFAVLERECGIERYGLSRADAHALSAGWLALYKISGWLDKRREGMGESARAAFEKVSFTLPVPASEPGLYRLADARFSRPSSSSPAGSDRWREHSRQLYAGRAFRSGWSPVAREAVSRRCVAFSGRGIQ